VHHSHQEYVRKAKKEKRRKKKEKRRKWKMENGNARN
jgi:hypothetical protein